MSEHPCLVPNLSRKAFVISQLIMFTIGFHKCPYPERMILYISSFLRIFYHDLMWNFAKGTYIMVCVLHFFLQDVKFH